MVNQFSVDGIINLARLTVCNPVFNVAYLAYLARQAGGVLPPFTGSKEKLVTTSYLSLGLWFTAWLSNRWRNGLISAPKKLKAKDWPKEIAVVTGGAAGMGKAVAERLAKKGAKVACLEIVDFKPTHPNIKAYKTDIGDLAAIQAAAAKIKADFGGEPTMVLNIAGINNHSLILDLTKDQVDRMLRINLASHFYTTMTFLPAMVKAKRGHLLFVSSTMGMAGITHQSDYVAAKHGVVGMTESLRYELDKMYKTPYVRTTLAIVGHTRTGLFKDFNVTAQGKFLGPLLETSDIADAFVSALEKQESRRIILPKGHWTVPAIKAMPSFLRDYMQWASGADGAYPSRPTRAQLGY